MPLSKQQLCELRAMIDPIIKEALSDSVEAAVEQAIKGEYSDRSYLAKILGGSGGRAAKGDLARAAQVFARLGMVAAFSHDTETARDMARVLDVSDEFATACKAAQTAGSAANGGLLIADDMAADVIPLLRPYSVTRRIGALEVSIPRGTKQTPKITSGVSSGYVGEGQSIPSSQLKTGAIVFTAHKLATLVVLSNEMRKFSADRGAFGAETVVFNDMMASIGQVEDDKFLFGTGTQNQPLGITLQVASGNKFNANGTINVTNVVADLQKAMTKLGNADIPMHRPAWIWAPRTTNYLMTLLDANGHFVFRAEVEQGRLFRWPYFESNNIPINLGAGSDESKVILVDAAQVMIGDVDEIDVARTDSATVTIDGQSQNLFERDMSALRIRRWNDILLRYSTAIAVIEAVKWGA